MPKTAIDPVLLAAYWSPKPPKRSWRREPEPVQETAVYTLDGQYFAERVGDDVYRGGHRIFYIDSGNIYDRHGMRQYYIDGRWWFDNAGRGCFYQNDEMKDSAELAAEAEAEQQREADYEAWRQAEIDRRKKAEAENKRRKKKSRWSALFSRGR